MFNRGTFYIKTPLDPGEALARIRGAIYTGSGPRRSALGSPHPSGVPFTGSVSDDSFHIQVVNPMDGNSIGQPILDGRVEPHAAGACLIGDIRQSTSATVAASV